MAIQALAPVEASMVLQIRFDLPGTKKRLQLSGEIAWADASGRAGIRCFGCWCSCCSGSWQYYSSSGGAGSGRWPDGNTRRS